MNVHQTIIKGIKEQLFFNNYMVLPNFGGFILKQNPSHFSPSGGMLMPPAKTISFNSQLKQNDGILALWLQTNLVCSNTQALNHLNDFAEYCKSILANKGRLTIDGLGFFYADLENNICFEPQQQINFLTASFGLSPISVKEIEPEPIQKTETIFVDRIITAKEVEKSTETKVPRNYRRAVTVSAFVIVLLSGLLFIVSNSKLSGKLKASVFGKEQKSVYTPILYSEINLKSLSADKKDYVADANGVATLDLENNKTIAVQALENTNPEVTDNAHTKNTVRSSHRNFEIVLGAFSIVNNARRMVKKLKSQNIAAELTGQNNKGLYIVASGNFNTKEEALAYLPQLKGTCPNAWIKKGE